MTTLLSSTKTTPLSSPTWLGIQNHFLFVWRKNTSWIPAFAGMTISSREWQISRGNDYHYHTRNLLSGIKSNCHPQLDWGSSILFLFLCYFLSLSFLKSFIRNPDQFFTSIIKIKKKRYFSCWQDRSLRITRWLPCLNVSIENSSFFFE